MEKDKKWVMGMLNEPLNGLSINYSVDQSAYGSATNTSYTSTGTSALQSGVSTNTLQGQLGSMTNAVYIAPNGRISAWDYWTDYYYPYVIRESYPVYIQEKAMDKGQKAFEILKILQDKKVATFKTVGDFIETMDALIKVV